MNQIIGMMVIVFLPFFTSSTSLDQRQENVYATYTYTSRNCNYRVYQAQAKSFVECHEWSFVGTVTPNNGVSVELFPGDRIIVRVMKGGSSVCNFRKLKRTDDIYLPENATRSSRTARELHDWTCE